MLRPAAQSNCDEMIIGVTASEVTDRVAGDPARRGVDELTSRSGLKSEIETLEPRLHPSFRAHRRLNQAAAAHIPPDAARQGSKQLHQRGDRPDLCE